MQIIIDKNGKVAFDDYFDERDIEKLKELAPSIFGKMHTMRVDDNQFKNTPALWKKKIHRDIDWSDWNNIYYILTHPDKRDDEISVNLKSEGTGFAITLKGSQLYKEFDNWRKKNNKTLTSDNENELKKDFSKEYIRGINATGRKANTIQNGTSELSKRGCNHQFPECSKKFSDYCLKCPFNINPTKIIKDNIDIKLFNEKKQ